MTYSVHNIHAKALRTTPDGRTGYRWDGKPISLGEPLFQREDEDEAESERLTRLEMLKQPRGFGDGKAI